MAREYGLGAKGQDAGNPKPEEASVRAENRRATGQERRETSMARTKPSTEKTYDEGKRRRRRKRRRAATPIQVASWL